MPFKNGWSKELLFSPKNITRKGELGAADRFHKKFSQKYFLKNIFRKLKHENSPRKKIHCIKLFIVTKSH